MKSTRLNRRAILGSLGSAAITAGVAPFIPKRVWAQPGTAPRRIIAVFTTQGWTHDNFFPAEGATENNWEPGPAFEPIKQFKQHINIIDGLRCYGMYYAQAREYSQDNAHGWGTVMHFTGSWPQSDKYGGGISIDQAIANKIWADNQGKLAFRDLALGVGTQKGHKGHPFYTEAGKGVSKEENPGAAFTRIFGDFNGGGGVDTAAFERLRKQKKTVIDLVKKQVDEVKAKVARPLKADLDDHLDGIRQLENKLLASLQPPAPSCSKPMDPGTRGWGGDDTRAIRAHMDILTSAFACDLTRVGILQLGHGDGGVDNPMQLNHHGLAHGVSGKNRTEITAEHRQNFKDILRLEQWHMSNFAYLLEKLDSIRDPDGATALENTLILFGHDTANIHTGPTDQHRTGAHRSTRDPMFTIGGRNFAYPTGRYIVTLPQVLHGGTPKSLDRFTPHNRLLTSVGNAFGLNINKFGTADPGTGNLPGLS